MKWRIPEEWLVTPGCEYPEYATVFAGYSEHDAHRVEYQVFLMPKRRRSDFYLWWLLRVLSVVCLFAMLWFGRPLALISGERVNLGPAVLCACVLVGLMYASDRLKRGGVRDVVVPARRVWAATHRLEHLRSAAARSSLAQPLILAVLDYEKNPTTTTELAMVTEATSLDEKVTEAVDCDTKELSFDAPEYPQWCPECAAHHRWRSA